MMNNTIYSIKKIQTCKIHDPRDPWLWKLTKPAKMALFNKNKTSVLLNM